MRSTSNRSSEQGFTLVEMMIVVVMVGVLATLAVFGVRKYILSAKMSEAVSMMTSIKTSEEAFKDETFVYLSVSPDLSSPTSFYPAQSPGKFKTAWGDTSTPAGKNFATLGVQADGPVMFSYAAVAGGPNDAYPNLPTQKPIAAFNLPNNKGQWYVALAKGDLDGDGATFSYVLSHSMSNEVYIENDGE